MKRETIQIANRLIERIDTLQTIQEAAKLKGNIYNFYLGGDVFTYANIRDKDFNIELDHLISKYINKYQDDLERLRDDT